MNRVSVLLLGAGSERMRKCPGTLRDLAPSLYGKAMPRPRVAGLSMHNETYYPKKERRPPSGGCEKRDAKLQS